MILNENIVRVKYLCTQVGAVTLAQMPGPPSVPTVPPPPSAPRTARARVRQELTSEILEVARRHLAEEGAAALSLRSVARDLGMAPSALYRYFDGRDCTPQRAHPVGLRSAGRKRRNGSRRCPPRRAGATPSAGRPSPGPYGRGPSSTPTSGASSSAPPCPGTRHPSTPSTPYARIAAALMRPVVEAKGAGRLRMDGPAWPAPAPLGDAVAPVRDALLPDMPVETVVAAIQAWTTIIGAISLEVFGHWRNTVLNPGELFEAVTRDLAASLGLG